jgi:hypothetical protein
MANDDNNWIMWLIGGIAAAVLGVGALAGMNKPAGGSVMKDTPKPKSPGCGCGK